MDLTRRARVVAGPSILAAVLAALPLAPPGPRRAARIALVLGCSPRHVKRALRELRELGHDVAVQRGRPPNVPREGAHKGDIDVPFMPVGAHKGDVDVPFTVEPLSLTQYDARASDPDPISLWISDTSLPPFPSGAREAADLAAVIRSFAGREGGIDLAISQIRKSWPAATPAEAGHALRTFLGLEGATVERAARWFERAPRLPGMDRAGWPWRAAATLHRAGPWLAAELDRAAHNRAELREVRAARRAPRATAPSAENLAVLRGLGVRSVR
jgi:hypothetical protein